MWKEKKMISSENKKLWNVKQSSSFESWELVCLKAFNVYFNQPKIFQVNEVFVETLTTKKFLKNSSKRVSLTQKIWITSNSRILKIKVVSTFSTLLTHSIKTKF
jgi:hypothetical protein